MNNPDVFLNQRRLSRKLWILLQKLFHPTVYLRRCLWWAVVRFSSSSSIEVCKLRHVLLPRICTPLTLPSNISTISEISWAVNKKERKDFFYHKSSTNGQNVPLVINTLNMTNPTIVSPVKMEYGWNFSVSGLKMMVKNGLEKIFLKFLHALTMSFLLLNLYFWPKLLHSIENGERMEEFQRYFF